MIKIKLDNVYIVFSIVEVMYRDVLDGNNYFI